MAVIEGEAGMKHWIWATILPFFVASATAETDVLSADDWYKNHYAPLYAENPWDNVEQLAKLFDADFHYHMSDGTVEKTNGATWISEGIAGWKAEGWLGSELVGYKSDLLNATTAVFKAKWRDTYADGNIALECGWYMADLKDDSWVFTQYAGIDCEQHGL